MLARDKHCFSLQTLTNYSFRKLYNIVPRAEVQSGSPRGKQLTEIMEKGELVPLVSLFTLP
jgi:hypothetical protein